MKRRITGSFIALSLLVGWALWLQTSFSAAKAITPNKNAVPLEMDWNSFAPVPEASVGGAPEESHSRSLPAPADALATTYTVNVTTDTGAGTGTTGDLRYAITQAQAGTGGDTINITATGTITLTNALPAITKDLTITGPGAKLLTINGNNQVRGFTISTTGQGANVNISNLTIANGASTYGGGIDYESGYFVFDTARLVLTNIAFINNVAQLAGGGVFISSGATGVITNCTFANNSAPGFDAQSVITGGGGIFTGASFIGIGHLSVANSTFYGNQGTGGGGINAFGSLSLTVTNSTFQANSRLSFTGSGIFANNVSTLTVKNTISAGNSSGQDLSIVGGAVNISNSLFSSPVNTVTNGVNGNIITTAALALLGPIGDYGGPTQTIPLLPGSPAINAGDNCVTTNNCAGNNLGFNLTTDQRGTGFPRLFNGTVDMGAYENRCSLITGTMGGGGTICATQSANVTVTVSGGVAPYTVTLTNGGGTKTGNGPTFTFPVTPADTTSYQAVATSRDSNNCLIINSGTATVTVSQLPTTANAGPDQTACGTSTTLAANAASAGAGAWTIVSGAGGAITTPSSPTSAFTGVVGTIYTLRWTISSAPCTASTDTVIIRFNPTPTVINPAETTGTLGTAFSQTFTQTGGFGATTFSTASVLPTGLTLSLGGVLSGTPTQAGTFPIVVKATDSNGCMGTQTYILSINYGLQFYPLAHPIRLLDTRAGFTGCDSPAAKIAGGTSRTQAAAGRTCDGLTIPANAAALVGNATSVQSGGGYFTLYPSDIAFPNTLNSFFAANQILNSLFTVRLGANDGAFKIFVSSDTDIVVDITGYYAPPSASGLYFHPLAKPVRLLDTRPGQSACFTPGTPLQGNTDTSQIGTTTCDGALIPAGAQALVGNATTVSPQANGFLTLYPSNAARPLIASANFQPGVNLNSPFMVKLSPSGQFNMYVASTTDLVVDVTGYYSTQLNDSNGQGLLFNPLRGPVLLLNTLAGEAGCYTPQAPMTGGTAYTQASTGACANVPATAQAVVGNAIVVNPVANGYLTFWPSDANQPFIATSNYRTGIFFSRHFTVGLGDDGAFKRYAATTTDLVIDLIGYFAP